MITWSFLSFDFATSFPREYHGNEVVVFAANAMLNLSTGEGGGDFLPFTVDYLGWHGL